MAVIIVGDSRWYLLCYSVVFHVFRRCRVWGGAVPLRTDVVHTFCLLFFCRPESCGMPERHTDLVLRCTIILAFVSHVIPTCCARLFRRRAVMPVIKKPGQEIRHSVDRTVLACSRPSLHRLIWCAQPWCRGCFWVMVEVNGFYFVVSCLFSVSLSLLLRVLDDTWVVRAVCCCLVCVALFLLGLRELYIIFDVFPSLRLNYR